MAASNEFQWISVRPVRRLHCLLLCLFLGGWPAQAAAEGNKVVAPETIPGTTRVDAEGVIALVEKMPDVVLIDSRVKSDRLQGYIEGSISLPDGETHCRSLAKVVRSRTSPVLFYCNGVKCGRSVKAIEIAVKCGYSKVYWFRGGFEEWKEKSYPYLKQ